jgi:hypothetical protein
MAFGYSHSNRHQTDANALGMTLAPPREVSGKVGRPRRGLGLGGATRPAGVGNGGPPPLEGSRRVPRSLVGDAGPPPLSPRPCAGSHGKHAERGRAYPRQTESSYIPQALDFRDRA